MASWYILSESQPPGLDGAVGCGILARLKFSVGGMDWSIFIDYFLLPCMLKWLFHFRQSTAPLSKLLSIALVFRVADYETCLWKRDICNLREKYWRALRRLLLC
jgi:hypothetical protein